MQQDANVSDIRKHISQVYGGMFAGIIFMASIASCFSLASTLTELATFLFACVTSATLMFAATQFE